MNINRYQDISEIDKEAKKDYIDRHSAFIYCEANAKMGEKFKTQIEAKIDSAIEWDRKIAIARRKLDWESQIKLSIDPEKSRKYREESEASNDIICSMCGEFCAIKQINEAFKLD